MKSAVAIILNFPFNSSLVLPKHAHVADLDDFLAHLLNLNSSFLFGSRLQQGASARTLRLAHPSLLLRYASKYYYNEI